MNYKFLVTFGNSRMFPVVFDDLATAKESWQLSYSGLGGVTFEQDGDYCTKVLYQKELVGEIRRIEHYTSATHL
jgi:hypothetical protein